MFSSIIVFQVAIKYIKKSKIRDEHDLNRIRREIKIMSTLQHPNVVNVNEGKFVKSHLWESLPTFTTRNHAILVASHNLITDMWASKLISAWCTYHEICHRQLILYHGPLGSLSMSEEFHKTSKALQLLTGTLESTMLGFVSGLELMEQHGAVVGTFGLRS